MKRTVKLTGGFAAAIVLLTYCTERINIDLPSTYTRLVVEGYFTTDTMAHTVKLSRSADYFYNKPLEPVSGALVTIADGNITYLLKEDPDSAGLYKTEPDVFAVQGHTYTLHISNVDINGDGTAEEYSATGPVHYLGYPDSIQIVEREMFYTKVWEIRLFATDPAETRDYYMFRVYKNGTLLQDTLNEVFLLDDEYFNGVYSMGVPVQYLVARKQDEVPKPGDRITLEIANITKEYFFFINQVIDMSRGSGPFSGQPANVSTNLTNGAMGFFATYPVRRVSRIYNP